MWYNVSQLMRFCGKLTKKFKMDLKTKIKKVTGKHNVLHSNSVYIDEKILKAKRDAFFNDLTELFQKELEAEQLRIGGVVSSCASKVNRITIMENLLRPCVKTLGM